MSKPERAAEDQPVTRHGLVAAMLAVATFGALGAKPARAQLFGGGDAAQLAAILAVLETIRDFTIDIFGELERAFRVLGINIPWWAWRWLRELLAQMGQHAGEDSTVRETSVRGAVERSYPVDPAVYATPDQRQERAAVRAEAIRLRCEESMMMLGAIAAEQGDLHEADEEILRQIEDADSLVQIGKAQIAMMAITNSLLRQIIVQNAHIGQLLFDPAMERAAGLQIQLIMQEELGIRRDGLSPVGRMPGVP